MSELTNFFNAVGTGVALFVLFGIGFYKFVMAMVATRHTSISAEASRDVADAEVTTNTSRLTINQQEQIRDLTGKLEKSLTDITGLSVRVEQLTARVDNLDRDNQNKDQEIIRLRGIITDLETQVQGVRRELAEERDDKLRVIGEREAMTKKLNEMEAELTRLREQLRLMDTQERAQVNSTDTKESTSEQITSL